MRSYNFIEMYKEKNNLPSDYRASKELGVTRASISLYKNGRPLDEDLALKIAESIDIDVSEILYIIRAEKAKDEMTRKAWLKLSKLSKQSGRATANLLILNSFISFLGVIFYILC